MNANDARRAPDPSELKIIGIPTQVRRGSQPSRWEAIYSSMPEDKAIELTKAQALAFASWSRSHKKPLRRSRLGTTDSYAVWRPKT